MVKRASEGGGILLVVLLAWAVGGCQGDNESPSGQAGQCIPGTRKCIGHDVWVCSSQGHGFVLEQTCIGGTTCINGVCAALPDVRPELVDMSGQDQQVRIPPPCSASACTARYGAPGQCRTWTCKKGNCVIVDMNNGAPCDDGNPWTIEDNCQLGKCIGSPIRPPHVDADSSHPDAASDTMTPNGDTTADAPDCDSDSLGDTPEFGSDFIAGAADPAEEVITDTARVAEDVAEQSSSDK